MQLLKSRRQIYFYKLLTTQHALLITVNYLFPFKKLRTTNRYYDDFIFINIILWSKRCTIYSQPILYYNTRFSFFYRYFDFNEVRSKTWENIECSIFYNKSQQTPKNETWEKFEKVMFWKILSTNFFGLTQKPGRVLTWLV